MSAVHLTAPFKVSVAGYYINTACGDYMLTMTAQALSRTDDVRKVTCRRCQHTRAFAAILVPAPGPAGIPGEER